jgi:hypothetical protein
VSSLPLNQGQADTVTVTFDAGVLPASYTLKLTASAGGNSDFDSENVTVAEYLSVNAVAQQAVIYARPEFERTDTFSVRF